MHRSVILVALAVTACDGGDGPSPTGDSGTTTPSTGPLSVPLAVDLDPDLIPAMDEPAVGVFRGSVFAEADATSFGPIEGAVSLVDFTSGSLDFGTEGGLLPTDVVIGPLDPQIVWILGCFDTTDDDCESGDPITIPNENKFQLDATTSGLTLVLSLLNP